MKKFRGILIKRIDKTVEPDKKTGLYPHTVFRCRVSNAIVPNHRMMWEFR